MKASTKLAISLGSVFGAIAVALSLAFARFRFRRDRHGRSVPVDPAYESRLVVVGDQDELDAARDDDRRAEGDEEKKKNKRRWFGGAYGVTPIAEPGKYGTKQYLGGWFAIDAPTYAGWTASDAGGTFVSNEPNEKKSRESHFSRASRALKRTKRGPRPSRTTELARIEQDKGEGRDNREVTDSGTGP